MSGWPARSRFTLNELMGVIAVMFMGLSLLCEMVKEGKRTGMQTACAGQLRQVGMLFQAYKDDYRRLPEFLPPDQLGDYTAWRDLYEATDPDGTCFSPYKMKSGSAANIPLGDRTGDPRIPRLFHTRYGAELDLLCCPSQGESPFWKDIGPYYYNTSNPFNSSPLQMWRPLARASATQPLAGCQNPEYLLNNGDRSWRHGDRSTQGGINNHLFRDGSVRDLAAPRSWDAR